MRKKTSGSTFRNMQSERMSANVFLLSYLICAPC
jgi:hypothetical protein